MTDHDRKIAELKGFWTKNWLFVCENPEYKEATRVECNWSTDIAKAFELVDEVGESFRFSLSNCVTGPLGKQLPGGWLATFSHSWTANAGGIHAGSGVARTRSEAICRAYIALKEREGKK